jgi:hypothetical protein
MSLTHTREVIVERDGAIRIGGLPVHAGDAVKVLVIPKRSNGLGANRYPLKGTPLRYDNPFAPAIDPDDWEANR